MQRTKNIALFACFILLIATPVIYAGEGSGNVRLGYILTDDEGNLGVNQETFNIYEGPVISIEDFRYSSDYGFNVNGDFLHTTLNDRNLRLNVSKPGHMGLSFRNNQYRRIYDFNGSYFTRRRSTSADVYFVPKEGFKVFGGYGRVDKEGQSMSVFSPILDTAVTSTDYSQNTFHVGAEGMSHGAKLRAEYRATDFTDNAMNVGDRKWQEFSANAFVPVPGHKWITVAGGYRYRKLENTPNDITRKSNLGWASTRLYLPAHNILEGRFVAERIDPSQDIVETDNYLTVASFSHVWPRYGGLRIGYEHRIRDDFFIKSVSDGLLLAGWLRYRSRITMRGEITLRGTDQEGGTTLLGEEDLTRFKVSGKYNMTGYGDLSVSYSGRTRKNEDIGTKVDYDDVTTAVSLVNKKYGRAVISYTYAVGTYNNRTADDINMFEFSDHYLSGYFTPSSYRNFTVTGGATYYRSFRDKDIEKTNLFIDGSYHFKGDYTLGVKYNVYNYDDYVVNDRYYTGNIVDMYLIKSFAL